MQTKIHHWPVQIYYEDTDHSGVVYHANFLKYFERAREHALGCDILAKLWNEQGLGFAVYKADVTYQDGVEFAEVCDVRSQVKMDGNYKTLWRQEFWRPNAKRPAVIGDIQMITMDTEKRLQPTPDMVKQLMQLS